MSAKKLTPEEIIAREKSIIKRVLTVCDPNISQDKLKTEYSDWAASYDEDLLFHVYYSPEIIARELRKLVEDKKDVKILDTCAGTGLTGKALCESGFTDLEALDANPEMLKEAEKKNIYKQLHVVELGKEKIQCKDGAYDVVVNGGALCDGHIGEKIFSCFPEFIRVLRPGGFFLGAIGSEYCKDTYRNNLIAEFENLEKQGLLKSVRIGKEYYNHLEDYQEDLFIFQKI